MNSESLRNSINHSLQQDLTDELKAKEDINTPCKRSLHRNGISSDHIDVRKTINDNKRISGSQCPFESSPLSILNQSLISQTSYATAKQDYQLNSYNKHGDDLRRSYITIS